MRMTVMNKKIFAVFIILILLIQLSGCSHEQTEDIVIIFTNDVASAVEGDVGYAGVKGFKNELEQENKFVALVDAGDFLDGQLSVDSKGQKIVEIMNAVGYDAAVIGNQEFSMGIDVLEKCISKSDFTYLSCNMQYFGKVKNRLSKVKPYLIKNFGGTKVAFIGVTTPETLIPGKPAYNAILEDGEPAFDFCSGNGGQDLYDQVQKTVNKVRKKVDYVILLAHLGTFSVTEGFSSYEVIGNTSGIDIVIDGHAHAAISGELVINKEGEDVLLTSTGEKLQNVGIMQIHPDRSVTTLLYPMAYQKDEKIEELVSSLLSE